MNKKILLSLLCLYGTDIYAGGLYLSGSYSNQNSSNMSYETVTSASNEYEGLKGTVGGFPEGKPNNEGWRAEPFSAGLKEQHIYNIDKGNSFSFGVGWQIPKNPLRIELEYQKLKSSVSGFDMNVYDPAGKVRYMKPKMIDNPRYKPDGSTPNEPPVIHNGDFDPTEETRATNVYEFGMNFLKPYTFTIDSIIANVLFEIPVLGIVDPYVGFGVGKVLVKNMPSKDSDLVGTYEGSNGYVTATQYIGGIEVRIPETPLIFGVEYKYLLSKFMEKDDNLPYTVNNQSVLFKIKYDFISDII